MAGKSTQKRGRLLLRVAAGVTLAAGWLTIAGVRAAGTLVGYTLLAAKWTLTGPARAWFAPAWLLAALLTGAAVWPAAAWPAAAIAAVLLGWTPERAWRRLPRRRLSAREADILARVLAAAALLIDARLPAWPWRTSCLAAVVAAGAIPWWAGRRIRRDPDPDHIRAWHDLVVPAFPQLAGEWVERDDTARTAVLALAAGKADDVADLDPDIEALLRQRPGTVVLAADPRLTRDQLRVAWPVPDDADRFRLWDGPTLTSDGRYVAGYAHGSGKPIYGRIWRDGGACCTAVIGGPGSGKGVVARVWAMECGLSDRVLLLLVDGKGGAGIPEAEAYAHEYATRQEDWARVIDRAHRVMESRERRYGAARKSRFTPRPGEPVIGLGIDEGRTVMESSPQIREQVLALTGRGRSLGIHVMIDGQSGAAPTYGTVEARGNMLANGTLWIGQQGDVQGRQNARQDYKVDLSKLPAGPGWAYLCSRVVPDQAQVPFRGSFIASRAEIDEAHELGLPVPPTPFGVCEDWSGRVVHPALHPDDQAAADSAGPIAGTSAAGGGHSVGEDGGVVPAGPPHLVAVPAWSAPRRAPGAEKVQAALHAAGGAPLTRKQIAQQTGLSQRYVSEVLGVLADEDPPIAQRTTTGWRLAS